MAVFGFWNVDASRGLQTDDREIPRLAADLVRERSLDILFLIECGIPYAVLMSAFGTDPMYFPIGCGERFKVIAKFDPSLMERLRIPVPSDRYDMWHLKLPLQEEVIVAAVHGLDKRNNSESKQSLFLQQVIAALTYFESVLGHNRSIVLGDFNANPFESPIASALGMNAVISRTLAGGEHREIFDQAYPYFYNPMWNLYGDGRGSSAPATYYYRGSDPHELFWHMLDQVVVRPSLMTKLDLKSLNIVTSIQGNSLTSAVGIPNRTKFSDHLPVVFEIDLSTHNNKELKYAE